MIRLVLVKDTLGNLALANLAPAPSLRPDQFIQVRVGKTHASEPDLGLPLSNPLELCTSGEVKEVRGGRRRPLVLGDGHGTVKDESDCLQTRFREIFKRLERANPCLFLNGHETIPVTTGSRRHFR